jgi:Na+-driven multidrug efflux pump
VDLIIPMLSITEGTQVVVGNYNGECRISDIKKVIGASLVVVTIVMAAIAVGGVFFWRDIAVFFSQNQIIVQYSKASIWWKISPCCLFAIDNVI